MSGKDRIIKVDVTLVASDVVEQVLTIPPSFRRWTLVAVAKNVSASPGAVTFELQYLIDGAYYKRNPAGSGPLAINEANVITSEDVVQKVKLKITCAGAKPDGDAVIELWGAR